MYGILRGKHAQQPKRGGQIKGPGTGTSDSIKAEVPAGSYIMPADSTAALGFGQTAATGAAPAGKPGVPVNLSNGEYQLPPEQVHAVGVQALEQAKAATHTPVAQPQAQGGELFFANGGPVGQYSTIDKDELGRNNTPARGVIPKASPAFYTDSQGNTTKGFIPSQSREVMTVQQPKSTLPATIPKVTPGAAPGPTPGRADFNTNSSGTTGRGFSPSSSRELVPAGQPQAGQPQARPPLALPAPAAAPATAPVREPDYRARAETMARAKRDTAAWNAERAAQDARSMGPQPQPPQAKGFRANLPKAGAGSGTAAALAAVPEAINVYDVAQDPNTSKIDVATQAAEGTGKVAATLAGAAAGAQGGAMVGALGGPFAPVTVPLATAVGGIGGAALGYWGAGKAIEAGREAAGVEVQSPIDRVKANNSAAAGAVPAASASTEVQPIAQSPEAQPAAPAGNGYIQTGIGQGAAGGPIVGRVGSDGVPEFTNDVQAVAGAQPMPAAGFSATRNRQPAQAGAMTAPAGARVLTSGTNQPGGDTELARTGSAANIGNGVGTFSQAEAGDAALAAGRFERANEERAKMVAASRAGEPNGGLTIVGDSSRKPSLQERQLARLNERNANIEAQQARTELGFAALNQRSATEQVQQQKMQQDMQAGQLTLEQQQRIAQIQQQLADPGLAPDQRAQLESAYASLTTTSADRAAIARDDATRQYQQQRVMADLLKAYSETRPVGNDGKTPVPFDEWAQPALQSGQQAAVSIGTDRRAIAIRDNPQLSREQKAAQLKALGYN